MVGLGCAFDSAELAGRIVGVGRREGAAGLLCAKRPGGSPVGPPLLFARCRRVSHTLHRPRPPRDARSGEIRVIGATTLDNFRKFIEKDPGLERRFQQVSIEPPAVAETLSILRGLRHKYETHHGVKISDGALLAAANLSERYLPDRCAQQQHCPFDFCSHLPACAAARDSPPSNAQSVA